MPGRAATYQDRRLADAWRESVSGYLSAELGRPIRPRHSRALISDEIADLRGDVLGLDGLTFRTKYGKAGRLSESLDGADRLAADAEGAQLGIVVQRRVGRSTPEAYAVMTLETFAALVARLTPPGATP